MNNCVHHWLVESPSGAAMVAAQCKYCGVTRSFPGSMETQWDYTQRPFNLHHLPKPRSEYDDEAED